MITLGLSKIPESGFCRENNKPTCPYYDNEGGHNTCRLFDLLDKNYKQEEMSDKIISSVCTYQNKVVV